MRVQIALVALLLLAPLLLAGCTEEPPVAASAATARQALPDHGVLGEPAPWAADQGAKRHVPRGEARLFMAFAVETADPQESALVHGLYNMREHIVPDDVPGDGATAQWLYQFKDGSSITIQHVANASGPPATTSWGAVWDWGYWGLGDPLRPVGEWTIDSAEAATIAAPDLLGWGDAANDHLYLLFRPVGSDTPFWLVGTWWPDGTREHVLVDALSGEKAGLSRFFPLPAPASGSIEDQFVKPLKEHAEYPLVFERPYGRIIARVEPATPDALTGVFIDIEGDGWETARVDPAPGGGFIHESSATKGGGNATLVARLEGQAESFKVVWCADGIAGDVFGRTASDCDR